MAYNFSANQFERTYKSQRLGNWELAKWYPSRPRYHCGTTAIISDNRGHIVVPERRVDEHPWTKFRNTFDLPDKITRKFAEEYHESLNTREKWKDFPPKRQDRNNNNTDVQGLGITGRSAVTHCKSQREKSAKAAAEQALALAAAKSEEKDSADFKYVPGDFTPARQQHESRDFLVNNNNNRYKYDNDLEPPLPMSKLHLGAGGGEHDCYTKNCKDYKETFSAPIPLTASLTRPLISRQVPDYQFNANDTDYKMPMLAQHSITEKPNERCPSPVVPAYSNFEQAKRMHHDNLDHQPLPDCIADIAYRRQQITGGHPGLALDIDPIATGVGVRTYNAGPTHCTKMKVYRPKTCGVVPKVYNTDAVYRDVSSAQPAKKMGAMDLAICWDYSPQNAADEPRRSRHIDGSNDSAGPAVFTYVKSPRNDQPADVGRSAGVFNSTHGELSFFDKDILRRKTDFGGRKIGVADTFHNDEEPRHSHDHAHSASQHYLHRIGEMPNRYDKQYQSSPNITDRELDNLRKKYLMGPGHGGGGGGMPHSMEEKLGEFRDPPCKRQNPNFLQRAKSRLCHKVAPEPISCCHEPPEFMRPPKHCKAFRVGIPKFNASGEIISADPSSCGMAGHHLSHKVLVVPRPRDPYAKKSYNIDTLVPPFTSIRGGANDGGYPEHWRLASVYQHAYKPIKQRRKPLLQTVYK